MVAPQMPQASILISVQANVPCNKWLWKNLLFFAYPAICIAQPCNDVGDYVAATMSIDLYLSVQCQFNFWGLLQ